MKQWSRSKLPLLSKTAKKQAVGREIANRQVRANFQYQKFLMLGPTKMFKDGIKSEKCLV